MKFLLLILSACTLLARAGDDLRVLSFNLRYLNSSDRGDKSWDVRRDLVADVIKKDAPDFVGTQEAFRQMLDDVKARVPGYAEIGAGRDDGKQKGEYSAILYREAAWEAVQSGTFWLSDTPEVPGSSSWGNKVTRICTWGRFRHRQTQRELFLYNAHLDHQSQPSREKAVALILQRIAARGSEAPVIVTGDFNATPGNAAIVAMLQGPPAFTDAWLTLHKDTGAEQAGTFHDFSGRRGGPRIDYIFATAGVKPVEARILNEAQAGKWPSDHYPVRATLALPEKP